MLSDSEALFHLLFPALALFFMVGGVLGAAVGVGLIASGANTCHHLGKLNRYVSTRVHLRGLSIARDVGHFVRSNRRLIGIALVLSSVYSIVGLVAWFDSSAMTVALNTSYPAPVVGWLLESTRIFLILFSVFSLAVGIMIGWFSSAFGRLEFLMNRWYSGRQLARGVDRMYMPLDKLVETFPQSSGSIILAMSSYGAMNALLMWRSFS